MAYKTLYEQAMPTMSRRDGCFPHSAVVNLMFQGWKICKEHRPECPWFTYFSLSLSHWRTDDWFGEFSRFSSRSSSVYLCFSTHSRLIKGDRGGELSDQLHPPFPPSPFDFPLCWYPATEYIPPLSPSTSCPERNNKKKGKKFYCRMALLLTVSRGCQNPCELLRCGWRSCGWFVESGCSWRPGGSERWARPSPWGPFASP